MTGDDRTDPAVLATDASAAGLSASALSVRLRRCRDLVLGRGALERKLIYPILLFSSLVTCITTAVQTYYDVQSGLTGLSRRFAEITLSHAPNLTASLWNFDGEAVQVEIDGIARLPDIEQVRIRAIGKAPSQIWQAGSVASRFTERMRIPLVRGPATPLGELEIVAGLDGIYAHSAQQLCLILLGNALKTMLVAAFALVLVRNRMSLHLDRIAGYTRGLDPRAPEPGSLALARPTRHEPDVLDTLAHSINVMHWNLASAFQAVDRANHELGDRVAARTAALEASIESLRQAQDRLLRAEKMATLGTLAAGMAHEINTPAQFIGDNLRFMGQALDELLESARPVPAEPVSAEFEELTGEMQCAVSQSLDGIHRIGAIVKSVKLFSHPETAAKCPARPADLIQTAITMCRNAWKPVCELTVETEADLPDVPCRPAEIEQVLIALLVNAVQAIEQKGVSGRGQAAIGCRLAGGMVEFSIADSGIGIPPENRHRVWDLFFTTKPVGTGTGQGLAICQKIVVDNHGGLIDFDSEVGVGTRFFFRLPLQDADEAAALEVR